MEPVNTAFQKFKDWYPNRVLLFPMGDFYEAFYDDAKVCSRLLGLTIASRSKGENSIPLVGIPMELLTISLKKLLAAGLTVGILGQYDLKTKAGIVKRDILRTITPGIYADSAAEGVSHGQC